MRIGRPAIMTLAREYARLLFPCPIVALLLVSHSAGILPECTITLALDPTSVVSIPSASHLTSLSSGALLDEVVSWQSLN
jgi:hypothetical protein